MTVCRKAIVLAMLALGLAGCQREDPSAAIQRAIEQRLAERPGLAGGQMVLEMKDVRVEGNRAQAEVIIRSRSDQAAQMTFHYELHKQGSEWIVEGGRPSSGASPHPLPGESPDSGASLPPGHPAPETPPSEPK